MSRNDVILGAVALVLVVFSLVVSLVIPRRDPGFPGRNIRVFTVVAVLLVVAMLAAVEVLGEAHESEGAEHTESGETDTGEQGDTGGGGGGGGGGDAAAGQEIFVANCGTCHTLEQAGTTGTVGRISMTRARPGRRGAGHERRRGHAGLRRPALRGGDSERRGVVASEDGGPCRVFDADQLERQGPTRRSRRVPRQVDRQRRSEAERAGFEPATQLSPGTRFPVALLRPARTPLRGRPILASPVLQTPRAVQA